MQTAALDSPEFRMASGQFTPTSGHSLGDGFWDCCECDGVKYPSTSQPLQNARGMEHGAWSMKTSFLARTGRLSSTSFGASTRCYTQGITEH
jgi:hypothetical protein